MSRIERLREDYFKAVEEDNQEQMNELSDKISEIQRRRVYQACVGCLRMSDNFSNYMSYVKHFTEEAMKEISPADESYEIGSYYTKNKCPCVVDFDQAGKHDIPREEYQRRFQG